MCTVDIKSLEVLSATREETVFPCLSRRLKAARNEAREQSDLLVRSDWVRRTRRSPEKQRRLGSWRLQARSGLGLHRQTGNVAGQKALDDTSRGHRGWSREFGEKRAGTPWQSRLLAYKRAERKSPCMPTVSGPDRRERNPEANFCNCGTGHVPKVADKASDRACSIAVAVTGALQTVICPGCLPGID